MQRHANKPIDYCPIFFSNASSRINDRMREMTAYLFAELVEAAAVLFLNRSRLGSLRAQLEAEEDVTTLSFSIFLFAPLSVSRLKIQRKNSVLTSFPGKKGPPARNKIGLKRDLLSSSYFFRVMTVRLFFFFNSSFLLLPAQHHQKSPFTHFSNSP